MKNSLYKKGKYLSLLLRHNPEKENLTMDTNGFVPVCEILDKLELSIADISYIVENNDKRFSFSDDNTKIRANQGHSIDVNVELDEIIPPEYLYHGTSVRNKVDISESGLKKMKRLYVHLSEDVYTAHDVGKRRGLAYVFKIKAKEMYDDGIKIYKSKNSVYLTEYVDPKYIIDQL